ncbi:hypothetical protein [Streptomyces sp. NPDC007905]|uniref:hypothetical protein n=1 Tax=Streptomyces sp. NPDC007905 TaxID=3364788 RepID=UPI0036E03D12
MTTTTSADPTAKALLSITLPGTGTLSPEQLRGAGCVWCMTELHGDSAVDLQQRYDSVLGVVGRWYPRGCQRCSLKAVLAEASRHPRDCEQCQEQPTLCETRRALRALALELRR